MNHFEQTNAVSRADDFNLSRNHDGDFLLTKNGGVVEIAAKANTPLWKAILSFAAQVRGHASTVGNG